MDWSVIIKKFDYTTLPQENKIGQSSRISPSEWRRTELLSKEAVKESNKQATKTLSQTIHHLSVQLELSHHENEGLRAYLARKNKHKKYCKALDLQQREEYQSAAVIWSPHKVREARFRERALQREQQQEKAKKHQEKEQKMKDRLIREQDQEEKRKERDAAKAVREKEKAKKATERARKKEEKDRGNALRLTQKGKRKASEASASRPITNKRQKPRSGRVDRVGVQVVPSAAPTKTTSRGRTITLPSKFK
jgi:hypothetical protein